MHAVAQGAVLVFETTVGLFRDAREDVVHVLRGAAAVTTTAIITVGRGVVEAVDEALFEGFEELVARVAVCVDVVFVGFGAGEVFCAAGDEVSVAVYALELLRLLG